MRRSLVTAIPALMLLTAAASAQFNSGSTGADGALSFPVGDGSPQTIIFDPAAQVPPVDVDRDGVYHFTTITVPANITVRLSADKCGFQPLFWLATGAVDIAGTLDLSGEDPTEYPAGTRTQPTVPGPGGFPGGIAAPDAETQGLPGYGPGGGQFPGHEGAYATGGAQTFFSPTLYGNEHLVPLIGGSGGAGSSQPFSEPLTIFTGGAGGGAILIASNTSISITGTIDVLGGQSPGRAGLPDGGNGQGFFSGDGSAGAIRLAAPQVTGTGSLLAATDSIRFSYGGWGRVRLEALDPVAFSGTIRGVYRRATLHPTTPLGVPQASTRSRVIVTRIGGVTVPARPAGSFNAPDINLSTTAPILFEISAANVPLDATVTLYLFSDSELLVPVLAEPLVGTAEASTTTVSTTLPAGFSKGFATAVWLPQ